MLGMEGMLTGESALLVSMKSAKYTRSSRKSARHSHFIRVAFSRKGYRTQTSS